jgi:predicted glycosyl hydrolase (DUF1957 family)
VAILQEHPRTPVSVVPPLQAALTDRVVVDQATGYVSERLDVSTEEAFRLLRGYARAYAQHLTDAARHVTGRSEQRDTIVAALVNLASPSFEP